MKSSESSDDFMKRDCVGCMAGEGTEKYVFFEGEIIDKAS